MQIARNTTKDEELIEAINKSFDNCDKHIDEAMSFLRKEGVSLPPYYYPPGKPKQE